VHRARCEADVWIANIRAEAAVPGTLVVVVMSRSGSIALFPENIVGQSDAELQAYIAMRLAE